MAALALPVLALAAITVVEVGQGLRERRDVLDQARMAKAATGPSGLLTSLQNERNRAAVTLLGVGAQLQLPCADNATCRSDSDRSLTRFRDLIAGETEAARDAYAPAFDQLEQVEKLRQEVDAYAPPPGLGNIAFTDEVFARYTELVDSLLTANSDLSLEIDEPELRRGAELSTMASRQTDLMARLVRSFLIAALTGGLEREDLLEGGELFQLATKNYAAIRTIATDEYAEAAEQLVADEDGTGFLDRVAPETLETGRVTDLPGLLGSVSVDNDTGFYGFRERVDEVLEGKADDVASAADRRAQLFWVLGLGVLGIALLATWLVSRSITRPLRSLTHQSTDMAHHRLPDAVLDILDTPLGDDVTVPEVEPVEIATRDEVADVARSLNTVQDSALGLAVEQAVLRRNIADSFVNLGRRNQNLLGRQLDFITELEGNETDPDTLANLFRLDHLATRMRRNAESLLVLAGIDPPRKWAAPVRITDAIRAALGEVEDYQRVTVRAVEPATVLGTVAADLAHLLAELIENALVFSPPDQTVEIRGGRVPAGILSADGTPTAGGYTLAVIDTGLGMSAEEIERANRRLAGAESFTIAPSKYLGHYVAGNLAARHNIAIRLHPSPANGLTATITLPLELLAEPAEVIPTTAVPAGEPVLTAPPLPDPPALSPLPPPPPPPLPEPAPAFTASGLAKRTPRGGGPAQPSTTPAAAPNDELLQTLVNYTSQAGAAGGAGSRTSSGLARRVRGAQLPNTRPVKLRRSRPDREARGPGDRPESPE